MSDGEARDGGVVSARVADTLERYVSVASPNPRLSPGPGEADMAELLASDLEGLGARVECQEVEPGRSNVLGYLEVDPRLPTVTFDAHIDTVPLGERATNHPRWEGDLLFARGACDDKGSLAAMVEAIRHVVTRSGPPAANVRLLGSVDEEAKCRGADAAHDLVGDSDLIIVGEPTELDIGIWHKGTTRFEIETRGRASHSAMPHLGQNAIELMATVVSRLVDEVRPELTRRDLAAAGESATMNIGAITGGGPLNQVPDHCTIGVDVRRLPEQGSAVILELFDVAVRDLADNGVVERRKPFVDSPTFRTSCSEGMLDAILSLTRKYQRSANMIGLPYGTNASRLARSGAPTLVVGPGSIKYAHTEDEHVRLDETVHAANLFVDLVDNLPHLVSL